MRKAAKYGLAFLALVAGTGQALAFRVPEPNAPYPTRRQIEAGYADSQNSPWASSYSEQAAQRLGFKNGSWNAFETRNNDASLNAGINARGAVLRLQW